jgi:hypothetical protein
LKRWTQFILCLLLSASIWLVHNLSQEYAGVVYMSVVAHSGIKGRAETAREAVTVSARCSATGFRLLRLKHDGRDITVDIHAEDLVWSGDDRYVVSAAEMAKYASDIFGEGVTLLTFLNQNYTFEFAPENCRTVPVKAVYSASFKPQYMAAGPMQLRPDSVTVYGDDSRLATIDAVLTKSLSFNDLTKSASGVVKLVQPQGLRISEKEVTWSLDVARFVEIRSDVKVEVRNVPPGVTFSAYPSTALAVFRCQFPSKGNPLETTRFYVDYRDFASSVSGRCVAHCENLPQYVIDWRLEPEVFDCMVREDAQ